MPFMFNPCQPCCTTCGEVLIQTTCCPQPLKRAMKVTFGTMTNFAQLSNQVIWLNYSDLTKQWEGYAVVNGVYPVFFGSTKLSQYVAVSLKCLTGGTWQLAITSSIVQNLQHTLQLYPAITRWTGLTAPTYTFAPVASTCSPFSLSFSLSGITWTISGTGTSSGSVSGIAGTCTVEEVNVCVVGGRICEYGSGTLVFPDVLNAFCTAGVSGLDNANITLIRDYGLGLSWSGWIKHGVYGDFSGGLQIRLQIVNMAGAGSDVNQILLGGVAERNTGLSLTSGESFVGQPANGVPINGREGYNVANSVTFNTSGFAEIDFSSVCWNIPNGGGSGPANMYIGLGSSDRVSIQILPGASGEAACSGLPDTLHATVSASNGFAFPMTITKQPDGTWYGLANDPTGFVTSFGGLGPTDVMTWMYPCTRWGPNNYNATVQHIQKNDGTGGIFRYDKYAFMKLGISTIGSVQCSPFLIDTGEINPQVFGSNIPDIEVTL